MLLLVLYVGLVYAAGLSAALLAAGPAWERAQEAEQRAGRERAVRWGPRTLDVDVLWIDGVELDDPDLTVPHPRMFERRFVLAPLAAVAPDVVPAGWERDAEGRVDHLGPL